MKKLLTLKYLFTFLKMPSIVLCCRLSFNFLATWAAAIMSLSASLLGGQSDIVLKFCTYKLCWSFYYTWYIDDILDEPYTRHTRCAHRTHHTCHLLLTTAPILQNKMTNSNKHKNSLSGDGKYGTVEKRLSKSISSTAYPIFSSKLLDLKYLMLQFMEIIHSSWKTKNVEYVKKTCRFCCNSQY